MKLAALMVVRNEASIIADSVGHLLQVVQVDRLYIADNGSTDATHAILQHVAQADRRVLVSQAPGQFRQPEIMRDLVRQAIEDDADWVLPNDADEFLWWSGGALRHRCAATPDGIGGLHFRVCNFAQLRTVRRDRPGTLATMVFRATPEGSEEDARNLVCSGTIPFVRMRYPRKMLLRAVPGLAIARGQHYAEGLAGPMQDDPVADLLHAPIRSRDDLPSRVDHGRRLAEVAIDAITGWHVQRLAAMDGPQLDAEWQANSVHPRQPFGPGFRLDLRLAWLAWKVAPFRRMILGQGRGWRTTPPRPAPPQAPSSGPAPTGVSR